MRSVHVASFPCCWPGNEATVNESMSLYTQAQLWFYNLSEEMIARVRHQLNMLGEWQQMRAGLLHHILAQKMGLFQHTHARDIQNCTKVWQSMLQ